MMKHANIRRTLVGLAVVTAVAGGLTFGGSSRAYANGDSVNCDARPSFCQVSQATGGNGSPGWSIPGSERAPVPTTMAPERIPFVDLSIILAGQYPDGTPVILISNLGTEDAGRFMVLQISAPGQREMEVPGLPAGQTFTYHDPSFPADCGTAVQIRVNVKHSVPDYNPANDNLFFTPACGPAVAIN